MKKNLFRKFVSEVNYSILILLTCFVFSLKANSKDLEETVYLRVGESTIVNPWRAVDDYMKGFTCSATTLIKVSDNTALSVNIDHTYKTKYPTNVSSGYSEGYYNTYKIEALKEGSYVVVVSGGCTKRTLHSYENDVFTVTYHLIIKKEAEVKSIVIPSNINLKIGEYYNFKPQIYEEGAVTKLSWFASDTDVISMNNGVIQALSCGTSLVTCTASNGVNAECKVTVEPVLATDLKLDYENIEIFRDEELTLTTHILPDNTTNKKLKWQSSNENIAFVSVNGTVIGINDGYCNITASTTDGSNLSASCVVKVKSPVVLATGLTFDENERQLAKGEKFKLFAIITPENVTRKSLTWKSNNTECASVNEDGLISAIKEGKAVITATTTDGSNITAECKITVISDTLNEYVINDYIDTYTLNVDKFAKNIIYNRQFEDLNWQPLYIPFSINFEDWEDNFDVAYLNNVHQYDDNNDGIIDRTELEVIRITKGHTNPNTPYLIRAKNIGLNSIYTYNKILKAAESASLDCSSTSTRYTFIGNYITISGNDLYNNHNYIVDDNVIQKVTDDSIDLQPFRWYLSITDRNGNTSIKTTPINIIVRGENTSCDNNIFFNDTKFTIYDIDGNIIKKDTDTYKDIPQGIYIINGKKMKL